MILETLSEQNKFVAIRDTLMYEISYLRGLRPLETRCIEISHISFEEKRIFIPADNNKERHSDYIDIPEFLIQKIWNYLQKRKIQSKWLFPCYWNELRNQDLPVNKKTFEKNFTRRMKKLGFLHVSFIDKQGKPRYNLNLYSFRKRFGTEAYKTFNCPKKTANVLRHYDPQLKSVWRYVFIAQKEERKDLLNEMDSKYNFPMLVTTYKKI